MSQEQYPADNPELTASPERASEQAVVEYLQSLELGAVSTKLFNELARIMVVSTIEMVPLRVSEEGKTQVFLTPRPEDDVWAGQWHVPGTALRASDHIEDRHDFSDAFARLLGTGGELHKEGITVVTAPVATDAEVRDTHRGHEFSRIHYVEVEGEPAGEEARGRYFDVEGFPGNVPTPGVIDHHIAFIIDAASKFQEQKSA